MLQWRDDVKRLWFVTCLLGAMLWAQPAKAEPAAGVPLALGVIALVGVVVVAPIGAMITTLEGEPSKEWGRTSLVVGGVATAAGAITLVVGAHASDESRSDYFIPGGIVLGIGLNALLWGSLSEATLPADAPDSATGSQPSGTPAQFTVGGRF
jgi:hypothetical protein